MTDRAELARLLLQMERALLAQGHIRTLLAAADATVLDRRQDVRTIKARIRRAERKATS